MRLRNTVILAVLAAILAGWYFLVEQPRKRSADLQDMMQSDLAAFRMDEVKHVSIDRPGETLGFERSDRGWMMTQPLVDKAADGSVNQLLGALSDAEIYRDLGLQNDLAAFGLDPPSITVAVRTSAGDTAVALDIGKLTADKYYAYARKHAPRAPVLLVPTGIRRYASADLSDFRNQRLVSFGLSSVSSFTLYWPGRSLSWRRSETDDWVTYRGGDTIGGRRQYVEAVVRFIQGVRVSEFVPADQVETVSPLDTAEPLSATVEINDGSSRTVTFGRRLETRLYAKARYTGPDGDSSSRVVLIDPAVLQIFDSTVENMRERRLLKIDESRVQKLELVAPDLQVTLVRPGRQWGFPNPSLGEVDQGRVKRALAAAGGLEYDIVLDEDGARAGQYGLSNPDIRFTLYDGAGGLVDELALTVKPENPGLYVTTSRFSGVVATVGANRVETLVESFTNLEGSAGSQDG
jgi:hypothetical protein